MKLETRLSVENTLQEYLSDSGCGDGGGNACMKQNHN